MKTFDTFYKDIPKGLDIYEVHDWIMENHWDWFQPINDATHYLQGNWMMDYIIRELKVRSYK